MPAKKSFSRRILTPISMRTHFPQQFNVSNVHVVITGSCVTLFKDKIPNGKLIIAFEILKSGFGELKFTFATLRGNKYSQFFMLFSAF